MARIDNINRRRQESQQKPQLPPMEGAPVSPLGTGEANKPAPESQGIAYSDADALRRDVTGRVRSDIVQGMDYDDAMKQGNISPAEWIAEHKKQAEAEGRELTGYEMALDVMKAQDFETPDQKRRRERREQAGQAIANLGNLIGNAANLYYTARGGTPADLNTSMIQENERLRRIREKREALQERERAILMNARQGDIANRRSLAAQRQKLEAEHAIRQGQQAYDLMKLNANLAYKETADKARLEADARRIEETARHNKAMEGIGWYRATKGNKDKNESVSFITKYGDVHLRNPKDKRAITLSTLAVMRNNATGTARDRIDQLLQSVSDGKVDSYSDAELYVSQHIDNDPVALRHLYEQAKKYGRVTANDKQKQARDDAMRRNRSLGWGAQANSNENTDW